MTKSAARTGKFSFFAAAFCCAATLTGAALAQAGSEHGKSPGAPPPPAAAEQPAAPPPPVAETPAPAAPPAANPLGAGQGWDTKTQETANIAPLIQQDPGALALIQSINDYFNKTKNMQGTFLQTDPDTKQKRGKFYFERPGKVRFDYSLPSKQKIISDGKYLAIEDHDLKTSDRYPLEATPFRLLLAEDVNFLRDAKIIGLDQGQDVVVLTIEDKAEDAAGQIRLFFSRPELQLKEWIITDPQGLSTRIEITELELNKTVSADLFKFSDIGLPNFRQ